MRASLLVFFVATTLFAQRPNTCSDPYWKDTLRCTAFPNQVPQPNRNDVPVKQGDIQTFTRIWLDEDPSVRCTDGTAPLIYVDKAICTNPAGCGPNIRLGDPIESNKWLFTYHGGESCQGARCITFYAVPDDRVNMSSAQNPPMLAPDGITEPDPIANPVFASYNRVKMEKCTFDRNLGRTTQELTTTAPNGATIPLRLFFHGFRITEKAFEKLAGGLTYTTWRAGSANSRRRSCCGAEGAGKIAQTTERLPPLANAETVLLIGHSNGCHGMYHNADNLAATLAKIPGFRADVRVLFDENFMPTPEGEAAFSTSAPPNSDAYDQINTGTSAVRGESFTYDLADHFAKDNTVVEYGVHGVVLDASCMEAHANDGKQWKCRDRHHVVMNHVSTPFVIREDFEDPNRDHLDAPYGNEARWADERNFSWCLDANPCSPRFNAAEFRARITKQIQTMLNFIDTRSEMAKGIDRSGLPPTMFAWHPACGEHVGAYGHDGFFDTKISSGNGTQSFQEFLAEFMNAPRAGVRASKIDGVGGARTVQCR